MEYRGLWQSVLGELELTTSEVHYKTWFKFTSILKQEDGHVVIGVPNAMTKQWLDDKGYKDKVADVLKNTNEELRSVEFQVSAEAALAQQEAKVGTKSSKKAKPAEAATAPLPIGQPGPTKAHTTNRPSLNTDYTFDNFVVGQSNDLAYAVCKAVVKYPGKKYNPLFLHGGVGLGKTHLVQAIGNELLAQNPSLNIVYITSEGFTNEFIESIQKKRKDAFTNKYRNADVLIVDDVQFFEAKVGTQEEFFHTFNDLRQAGKQIIMTSDRPPKAIPKLEDRLRSRFDGGMTTDVQRPDVETRSAIIRSKAAMQDIDMPTEVTDYIARHYQHNIRELEGALTKLMAKCEQKQVAPTLAIAQEAIAADTASKPKRRTLTPKRILEKAAAHFDVSLGDLTGPRRDKDIVVPRQITMYVMRAELGLSYPKLGAAVGGRDHSTAMHSITKIEQLLESNDEIRTEVSSLRELLAA